MTEKHFSERYATPISIAVAGLFIAIAIFASKSFTNNNSKPTTGNETGTQDVMQDLTQSDLLKKIGVKEKALTACIAGEETKAKVDGDTQLGVSAGLQGTPHMVIISSRNGQTIQIPLSGAQPKEVIEKVIADEAAPAGQPKPTNFVNQVITDEDHVLGDRNAAVTIVEYSDIDCPFCKRLHPTLQALVDEGKIAWVYRQSPIPQLHPDAYNKAITAECIAKLGDNNAFWTYLAATATN
jgi:protein-disulfide isomerase